MKTAVIYADLRSDLGQHAEFQVQQMLEAGIKFLADNPGYDITADPAELSAAIRVPGISGGQYDTVMNHLRVIRENGYAWWLQELSKDRPDEVFDFDGTLASIPARNER